MPLAVSRIPKWIWLVAAIVVLLIAAALSWPLWSAAARQAIGQGNTRSPQGGAPSAAHGDHASHGHAAEHAHGHGEEAATIELSQRGLRNIGYRPATIELQPFTRTVTMPAIVVERPGQTQIHIAAPLTGVVTKIHVAQGAAVEPGRAMFDLRLTHEELVDAQRQLIHTAESLEIARREIARLKSLTEGVVAGVRVLEKEYEAQRLEAELRSRRQSLLLHGLNEEQIDAILSTKELFRSLTVRAPEHEDEHESCSDEHLFHVQELTVSTGQQVEIGAPLCVLADHCELLVEGQAFEDDAAHLREAVERGWKITATMLSPGGQRQTVDGLELLYLADRIDEQSRAFHFYLRLPNEVALDRQVADGRRYIDWRFKPGQRMELQVPVERWEDRIVLPVESVVQEGGEAYVYQQNGDHFQRVAVHVLYRDQQSVVVENDGAVFPGDIVASRGAYQMHLDLKNRAGGGIDPHAGHGH